jgi:hypothetical protein
MEYHIGEKRQKAYADTIAKYCFPYMQYHHGSTLANGELPDDLGLDESLPPNANIAITKGASKTQGKKRRTYSFSRP